ncbi:MAG: hypothetical protein A2V92_06495 [Candidatus Muproteobacteria bacterium RBG_16_65_31]|uniref:Uncharacterized protein n=1 Tax=Candidatus Muproteobacteria bacterium RBG_16_65_31 TaxID=1817759 RepID=A0A1F6TDI2_9PROT|nr:MAG: hypothetical protein A2V92_06495 [Candidatus Muproteobacteria bacterium RBG_16_65_31]
MVAGYVAELVIECLEVIHIHHDDGQRLLVHRAARHLAFQQIHQPAAVVEAGELVRGGVAFVQLLQPLAFGDGGIVVAQPLRQTYEHVAGHDVGGMDQRPEDFLVNDQQPRRGIGDDERRGRLLINHGQLADAFPGIHDADRLVVRRVQVDPQAALEHRVQRAVCLSRGEQYRAGLQFAYGAGVQQALDRLAAGVGEQPQAHDVFAADGVPSRRSSVHAHGLPPA